MNLQKIEDEDEIKRPIEEEKEKEED